MKHKANNHLLVSGDDKLSLPRRSECKRYLSSALLWNDSYMYIQITSEVIVCPITFTNGNYMLNISMLFMFVYDPVSGSNSSQLCRSGRLHTGLTTGCGHTTGNLNSSKFTLVVVSDVRQWKPFSLQLMGLWHMILGDGILPVILIVYK